MRRVQVRLMHEVSPGMTPGFLTIFPALSPISHAIPSQLF